MINWRKGTGGFVGGLKYFIKGVFSSLHSGTSAAPTPDCEQAFQGKIQEAGFQGLFTTVIAFQGAIDDTVVGLTGLLTAEKLLQGPLVGEIGFNGILTDEIGFQGDICED